MPVVVMLSGCGAGYDLDPTQGAEAEDVGSSQAAITQFNKYAVGVIPLDPNSCPADRRVSVYTDDEDEDNESDSTGWDPPNTARRSRAHNTGRTGTSWNFCKVDGRDFYSWTKFSSKTEYFYAVLRLGTDCPNGAQGATHYSTGELDNNESSWTGPMGGSVFLAPNDGSLDPNGPVLATSYCFFQDSPDKMTAFPDLGMQYAVFHDYDSAQPSFVLSKRWVYTDDEDDNITWSGNSAAWNFDALMDGNGNSIYDLARVR
jgi:hypothetical protein